MLLYGGDVASCDEPSLTKEPVVETARRSTLPLVFTGATVFCVVSPQQPQLVRRRTQEFLINRPQHSAHVNVLHLHGLPPVVVQQQVSHADVAQWKGSETQKNNQSNDPTSQTGTSH